MPYFFHVAAWLQTAALIASFYIHGFWITRLVFPNAGRLQWSLLPLLGALVQALLLAHLSYLGAGVGQSVWPVLALSAGLDVWIWLRSRQTAFAVEWGYLTLCGGITALFLLPYVLYNGYPFLGDSFMYDGISDFVREHGFFTSAEPAETYPWMSMMRYAQNVHLAMGASFLQAAAGELLRQESPTVFLPVTGAFLFLSLCGLRLLLADLGVTAGLLLYGSNVPLVLQPPALNVLRQTAGLGYLFLLLSLALQASTAWQLALALVGIVTFYPELLPFASAPLGVYLLWRRQWTAVQLWALAIGLALVLHLYGWFSAIQNVLFHWQAKPGFAVNASGADYAVMLAGGGGLLAAAFVAGLAAWGWWRLEPGHRVFAAAALALFGGFALYLHFGPHYSYGVYKNVLFSYYLIIFCLAAALRGQWRWLAVVGAVLALAFPVRDFVGSDYFIATDGAYQELRGPGRMLDLFRSIREVGHTQQRTLLAIADERLAKWFAYFYRSPVGLYFPGEYLNIARERPLNPRDTNFAFLLTANADTSLTEEDTIQWRNDLASFSKAQTLVTFGQTGWVARDVGALEASHTMGPRAEMLAYSPTGAEVQLIGVSERSNCQVSLQNGPPIPVEGGFWLSPALRVEPGFTTLQLTSTCAPLRWQSLTLVKPIRAPLNVSHPSLRQSLAGLTEDGWVLERGIRVRVPGGGRLRLIGEKAPGSQALLVGNQRTELPAGRTFDVTITLPSADVTIKPEHVESNPGDARRLGFRLTRVEPLT